jgi:tRNA (uracil-5-)-methyltransferase
MPPGLAQPHDYEHLYAAKLELTQQQFERFGVKSVQGFRSPATHFRMRAEFKIWKENGQCSYAMYAPGEYKRPVIIDDFSIGSLTITKLMPKLLAAINADEMLSRRLFQVEFLTTTQQEAIITLIYHRPLDEDWLEKARELEHKLGVHIIGRSRKQKLVCSQDYLIERFRLNFPDKPNPLEFSYQQIETGFTQPNASICQDMLNWAIEQTHALDGDLLELYCGNGNFTLPLAQNFRRVFATEISKLSTRAALFNIEQNSCDNITIARLSSEEVAEAFTQKREFRRLRDIDLASYRFSTVFVDPPRSGLDESSLELIANYDNILYISCNPETLEKNLDTLNLTHTIQCMAMFDQFPYTEHRECGVLLKARK